MTEEHDNIAANFGQKIRKILKENGLYDNNIDFQFKIGRYSIEFSRSKGVNEVLRDLPEEVFIAVKEAVDELHDIWENAPNEEEQIGDHSRNEYSVSIYVEGDPFELHDKTEIEDGIKRLELMMNKYVDEENFESAGRLKKRISVLKDKLMNK